MIFDTHIGIDYSGAETPTSGLAGLRVFSSTDGRLPCEIPSPANQEKRPRKWTRQSIAHWLVDQAKTGKRFCAGIDHAFSFPLTYFKRYRLTTWDDFLVDFCKHWPTYEPNTYVDFIRAKNPRCGSKEEYRLTERCTSSAKSVFRFDVQGQVAKSTHAGIPWLHYVRQQAKGFVHIWPFDGWELPAEKCIIAEVYPSIFRNRYDREGRSCHQQDAYAVARWLSEMDGRGFLERFCHPPLTDEERKVADLEGWILGVI